MANVSCSGVFTRKPPVRYSHKWLIQPLSLKKFKQEQVLLHLNGILLVKTSDLRRYLWKPCVFNAIWARNWHNEWQGLSPAVRLATAVNPGDCLNSNLTIDHGVNLRLEVDLDFPFRHVQSFGSWRMSLFYSWVLQRTFHWPSNKLFR